jgi:hypothetical protein
MNRLAVLFAEVVNGHDARVCAHSTHGLGFTENTLASDFVQAFSLDQFESNVSVEYVVVGEVDHFLATLTQQALDEIATIGEHFWRIGVAF